MRSTHHPTSITHNLAVPYTFSAKEKDSETGLSYFGARYYTSDLSIWLSVDPMSAKYPSLSPYVYCANNPIKLVDSNGEDYEVVVDHEKKIITICAVYFTKNENKEIVQGGLDYWNNQSGNFSLKQNGKQYTINFELTLAEGDFVSDDDARIAATLGYGQATNHIEFSNVANQKGAINNGNLIQLHPEKSTTRTLHHEIGHSLGMFDTSFDNNVMKSGGECDVITKQNVRQSVKGYYSNHTYYGGSTTHVGKCVNYIIGNYHGKIIHNK